MLTHCVYDKRTVRVTQC